MTFITNSNAQSRFKIGVGANIITNNYEYDHLYTYYATSLNTSYRISNWKKINLSLENNTSIRYNSNSSDTKSGITSSFPLISQYESKKIIVQLGGGPAYARQHYESKPNYNETVSGWYTNFIMGLGICGKPLISNIIFPEYFIRASFFKNNHEGALASLSFNIYLRFAN